MIQNIFDDEMMIQLANLKLRGTTLIWWESKTKEDLRKSGKILSYWNDFVATLRKQFYHLAYMQQTMISWKNI
jgi:hypothetical protein